MEPPVIQNDRETSDFAITVAGFRDFILGLPDRMVTVQLPYQSLNLTMEQVRDSIANLADTDYIFDRSGWYVVRKLESSKGWLRVTFDWRYWIYARDFGFGGEFKTLLGPDLCSQLDRELGMAYATYSAGLTLERFLNLMPALHYCADLVQSRLPQDSFANRLMTDPISILTSAVDVWRNDSGYIKTQFVGGGFGIGGALQGWALASTLNSFIDSQNRKYANSHVAAIEQPLNYGFQHLRATQRFTQI
jgi:hypothetical protein